MPTRLQTADDLHHLVDRTRHRLLRNGYIVATCGVVIIALLWLLTACLVDQWRPLSDGWRIVAFLLGISLIALAIGFAARSFMHRPSLHQVAMRIEATQPAMHNRLITVLDLHQQKQVGGDVPHEAFVSDLIAQTCQRMVSYRTEQVADGRPMHRTICVYAIVLIITAVCAAALGQRWWVSMARVLQPLASIAPMTAVEIAVLSGDVEVLQGEAVTLIGLTHRGSLDSMFIELRAHQPDGRWHRYPMSASNVGVFTFDITVLDQSYDYRLIGGGTWTAPHRVAMLERPVISDMQARLLLPAYMGLPHAIPISDLTRIAAPIGATVEFSANITGSVATAHLIESPLATTSTPPAISADRLWIDDALPADAQILGQWRWTDEHAHSGRRSHTFTASRLPYGFRSRLSPLVLTADSPFFIHIRLDPSRLPSSLTISLGDDTSRYDLIWASAPATAIAPESNPYLGKPRPLYMGPLPAVVVGSSPQWIRLEVSLEQLLGPKPAKPMSITSLMFQVQGGDVHFDSIGSGSLPQTSPFHAVSPSLLTHEMKQQGGDRWIARVQVQHDSQLVAEVRSTAGRAAPALAPMAVLAKDDQPPVVVMERAMRAVTLSGVQPVMVIAQVFDDFGLSGVGYQVARDPESFQLEANWIDELAAPATSYRLLARVQPVDGQGQPFKEGEAMYLRAAARDRKGQVAFGETIRFSFMKPSDTPEPSPQQRDDALAKLLAQLSSLAGKQEQLAQQMQQNLRTLPELLKRELPIDEQGRAIPQAETDRLLHDWFGQQNTAAQTALRGLDASATEHRASAARLAQQLEEQARMAGRSPLALPLEQEVLRQLAARLREALPAESKDESSDQAMLNRLRNMDRLTAAQQAALARAMQHLQTLQKAREQGSADPQQAATSLENLLTQLQAEGATRELQELTQALIQKQQRLAALHEQQLKLQRDAAAKAKQPDESIEKQQARLDEEMQSALNQSRQLLGRPAEEKSDHPEAKQRDRTSLHEQRDHRLAQLTLDRQHLASSREQAMQLAESLSATAARLSEEGSHDATATRDQVQSLMTSTTMKSLMRMAGRARMQAMEDRQPQLTGDRVTPDNPGQTTGEQNRPQVKRGDILLPAAVRDAEVDPSLAPALYRLPPHLRSALLQGMKEKGPQGYQSLIDGYHRHLAESVRLEP